jgi:hypothetical protein
VLDVILIFTRRANQENLAIMVAMSWVVILSFSVNIENLNPMHVAIRSSRHLTLFANLIVSSNGIVCLQYLFTAEAKFASRCGTQLLKRTPKL